MQSSFRSLGGQADTIETTDETAKIKLNTKTCIDWGISYLLVIIILTRSASLSKLVTAGLKIRNPIFLEGAVMIPYNRHKSQVLSQERSKPASSCIKHHKLPYGANIVCEHSFNPYAFSSVGSVAQLFFEVFHKRVKQDVLLG